MAIKRYKGQPLPIVVAFSDNPLTVYGKDYVDVTDVSMNLKKELATDLDNAYLEKLQSTSGVIVDEANNKFIMVLTSTDYSNLVAGQTYLLTLNVKVDGITDFLEMDIPDRRVEIVSDTNRA